MTAKATAQKKQEDEQKANSEEKKKVCFVITPIGPNNSDVRRSADGLINSVISPVVTKYGYEVIVAHKIIDPGNINDQVIKYLLNADLVITNLSGLNPNVMYELAIRHSTMKPVIMMADLETNLPFDILTERTIFFTNDMEGVTIAKKELEPLISSISPSSQFDNPISRVMQNSILKDYFSSHEKSEENDILKLLFEKIDGIQNQLISTKELKNSHKLSVSKEYFSNGSLMTKLIKTDAMKLHEELQSAIDLENLQNVAELQRLHKSENGEYHINIFFKGAGKTTIKFLEQIMLRYTDNVSHPPF